jgi:hypothetical protein
VDYVDWIMLTGLCERDFVDWIMWIGLCGLDYVDSGECPVAGVL